MLLKKNCSYFVFSRHGVGEGQQTFNYLENNKHQRFCFGISREKIAHFRDFLRQRVGGAAPFQVRRKDII